MGSGKTLGAYLYLWARRGATAAPPDGHSVKDSCDNVKFKKRPAVEASAGRHHGGWDNKEVSLVVAGIIACPQVSAKARGQVGPRTVCIER